MNFFIPGEMTTLNEYVSAERGNKFHAAQIKKDETFRAQMACNGLPAITNYPVKITITWYRRTTKTDPDNIYFAVKYILDGMQAAGVLRGDGWKEISGISHDHQIDKDNPGVDVWIE